MIRALAIVLMAAVPAAAQESEADIYGPILDVCYAAADSAKAKIACIGQMATTCMDTESGGHTTLGMAGCTNGEMEVWDKYLNAEYKATMAVFKDMDADESVSFPEYAERANSLRKAQIAWIAFRDAECGLAYAQWGSGSMRHIAGTSCLMQMTAERTIELFEMREEY